MRRRPRLGLALALSIGLLGCGGTPTGEVVELATAPVSRCFAYYREVVLVADPTAGVVARYTTENPGQTVPVVWPTGYVGRRHGSEIVVYDATGGERARTGKTAFLMANDLRNEPAGPRASCLDVSMEPLG